MKQETKKQEVQVLSTTALAVVPAHLDQSWDEVSDVEAADIRIPRLLLMQSTSELVGQRKAAAGDIVNSITGEKVGDETNPLEIVPIYTFKTWVVSEKVNGKFEFKRVDQYVAGQKRNREEVIGGVEVQNAETINVLVMLNKDQENTSALPYLMSFRMTSLNCGKDILTQKMHAINMNTPFQKFVLKLAPFYTKNDKGQYFVFKFQGKAENTLFASSAALLRKWYDTFKAGSVKVDEEVTEAESTSAPLGAATGERF